jgi:hypothetical protein
MSYTNTLRPRRGRRLAAGVPHKLRAAAGAPPPAQCELGADAPPPPLPPP